MKSKWPTLIITGLVLLVANLMVGAALGLLYVRLFVDIDMGFGGVADFLGGIMVGGLLGLVVSIVILIRMSVRLQWVWIGVAVVIASLTFAGLALTASKREVSSGSILKEEFHPAWVIRGRAQRIPEQEQISLLGGVIQLLSTPKYSFENGGLPDVLRCGVFCYGCSSLQKKTGSG